MVYEIRIILDNSKFLSLSRKAFFFSMTSLHFLKNQAYSTNCSSTSTFLYSSFSAATARQDFQNLNSFKNMEVAAARSFLLKLTQWSISNWTETFATRHTQTERQTEGKGERLSSIPTHFKCNATARAQWPRPRLIGRTKIKSEKNRGARNCYILTDRESTDFRL